MYNDYLKMKGHPILFEYRQAMPCDAECIITGYVEETASSVVPKEWLGLISHEIQTKKGSSSSGAGCYLGTRMFKLRKEAEEWVMEQRTVLKIKGRLLAGVK